jgi:acyl-CoA synthetase (AMP-forming)/AMP-acid ligase II
MLLLGAVANGLTVSPISPLLTASELSVLLAKARPALLCTTLGAGESIMRSAVQQLATQPLDVGPGKQAVKRWADDTIAHWSSRIFTVDTMADNFDLQATQKRAASDWTQLLQPTAEPFVCKEMSGDEQGRRAAVLLWSSGTTGQRGRSPRLRPALTLPLLTGASKGVLLSHRNFVANTHCFWTSCPVLDGPRRGAFGGGERWVALAP